MESAERSRYATHRRVCCFLNKGSLVDDALGPSKSAEEEDVVIELKEGEVTK